MDDNMKASIASVWTMRRRYACRVAIFVAVTLSVVVLTALYGLLFPDNYVGTRYWIPSSAEQVRVRLQWKSIGDMNPVIRTQVGDVKLRDRCNEY